MNGDPFDWLARMADDSAAPSSTGDVPEALLARILNVDRAEAVAADRRRSKRRRAAVAGTVFAAVAVCGGAVAAVLLRSQPADSVSIVCYSEASANPAIRVGLTLEPDRTAVEQCQQQWTAGSLGPQPVDRLVACVDDEGVTVVVPAVADEACQKLGWVALAEEPSASQQIDAEVAAQVPELFATCIDDLSAAAEQVRTLLDDLGADEWTVSVDGRTTTDRRCAANVIDAATHTVLIVAFQPPNG